VGAERPCHVDEAKALKWLEGHPVYHDPEYGERTQTGYDEGNEHRGDAEGE
jgi:hypothetical protein